MERPAEPPLPVWSDCPRCGRPHEIEARSLLNPVDDWSLWGLCRATGQPVVMRPPGEPAGVVRVRFRAGAVDRSVVAPGCDGPYVAWASGGGVSLRLSGLTADQLRLFLPGREYALTVEAAAPAAAKKPGT